MKRKCINCRHYKPGVETACALGVVKAEECLDPVRPRFASIWFQYKLWEPKEKDDEKSGVS